MAKLAGTSQLALSPVNDRQYRLLVESVTDYAIYMLDPDGVVASWNAGAKRFNGYASAEVVGRNFSIFYTPEDRAGGEPQRALQTASSEGRFESEGWRIRKDGSRFWTSVIVDPMREGGQLVGFAIVTRDISARRVAECALIEANFSLLQSQRLLRDLFEQSPGFTAVLDGPSFIYRMVNPAYIALVGQWPMIGLPANQVLREDLNQGFFDTMGDVFKTGRPYVGQASAMVLERKLGAFEQRYVDFVLQPMMDDAGKVSSILLQGNDVTQERHSVETLKVIRAELETALAANQEIFDHSLDVICMISADGRFMQVSKQAASVWGYAAEELIGRPYIDLVHPDDREATLAVANQVASEGKPTHTFRNRYIHKNGSLVPISCSAAWSQQQNALVCIARDMRESVATEEKLRQAQKLEAVGRLTGGVAHDFNNLLTVIIGGAETLVYENPNNLAVRELAEMIGAAGERGSELTSQLLAFARRQPLEPRALQVNDLLTGMGALLRRTLGEDVELRVVRDDRAWRTMADPTQLELAVLNLAINARHAMPSGGRLTIETANVALDQAYCEANDDLAAGDYLMVAVTDNGEGMSPETARQAFEPFFTTKATGKGTGLGLSMAHGFAKQSKGNIKIYSEPGLGTTIKLYLPRADGDAAAADRAPDEDGLPSGTEHVLLVEDDDLLRDYARKQLQRLGYRVTAAASGPKALEIVETLGDFDLLFTDVVMPDGLNGRQLADRVCAMRPRMRVLYTSGYSEEAIIHHGRLDVGVELLNKPYRKRELALKVRKVLDEQKGGDA